MHDIGVHIGASGDMGVSKTQAFLILRCSLSLCKCYCTVCFQKGTLWGSYFGVGRVFNFFRWGGADLLFRKFPLAMIPWWSLLVGMTLGWLGLANDKEIVES